MKSFDYFKTARLVRMKDTIKALSNKETPAIVLGDELCRKMKKMNNQLLNKSKN